MKLAVFGATGPTGRQFVEQAAGRNHDLRALVRPQSTAPDGVDAVSGDVLDSEAVAATVGGTDAVVCVLGLPKGAGTVISDGTANIISAMQAAGVNRLVAVTVHGLNDSKDDAGFFGKVIVSKLAKSRFEDRQRQEQIIFDCPLDWTVLRPARLVDGDRTGEYELEPRLKTGMSAKVRRADVADALLDLVESGRFPRQAVSIAAR
jgi:putative NADH-flavin reductase